MNAVRPLFATSAAIAVAAAGLIAATPATLKASDLVAQDIAQDVALTAASIEDAGSAVAWDLPDPFGVMQQVLTTAQGQISDAFSSLAAGEFGLSAGLFASGMANAMVYGPLASFLTVADAAFGQSPYWLSMPDHYFTQFTDFDGLVDQLNHLVTQAFERVSDGFEELAAGQFNHGLGDIFYAITNFVPDIPLQLMVAPAILLENMLDA